MMTTPEHKVTASEVLRAVIDMDKMAFETVVKQLTEKANGETEATVQLSFEIGADSKP
jgi:hypothetical protein